MRGATAGVSFYDGPFFSITTATAAAVAAAAAAANPTRRDSRLLR